MNCKARLISQFMSGLYHVSLINGATKATSISSFCGIISSAIMCILVGMPNLVMGYLLVNCGPSAGSSDQLLCSTKLWMTGGTIHFHAIDLSGQTLLAALIYWFGSVCFQPAVSHDTICASSTF